MVTRIDGSGPSGRRASSGQEDGIRCRWHPGFGPDAASKLFFDMGLMGLNGVWAVQSLKSIRRRCAMARQEVRSRAALRAVRCLHVPAFAASHRGEAGACECRMQKSECRMQNGKVMFGYFRICSDMFGFLKKCWVSQTCWLNSPSSYFSATRLRRGYGMGSKMANR